MVARNIPPDALRLILAVDLIKQVWIGLDNYIYSGARFQAPQIKEISSTQLPNPSSCRKQNCRKLVEIGKMAFGRAGRKSFTVKTISPSESPVRRHQEFMAASSQFETALLSAGSSICDSACRSPHCPKVKTGNDCGNGFDICPSPIHIDLDLGHRSLRRLLGAVKLRDTLLCRLF